MGLFDFLSPSPPPPLDEKFARALSKHFTPENVGGDIYAFALKHLAKKQADILDVLKPDEEILLIIPGKPIRERDISITTDKRVMHFNNGFEWQLLINDIADLTVDIHDTGYLAAYIVSNSNNISTVLMPHDEMCHEFMATIGRLNLKRSATDYTEGEQKLDDPLLDNLKQKIDEYLNLSLVRRASRQGVQEIEIQRQRAFGDFAKAAGTALKAGNKETISRAKTYSRKRLLEMGFSKDRQENIGGQFEFQLTPWRETWVEKIKESTTLEQMIDDIHTAFVHPLHAPKFTDEERQLIYNKLADAAAAARKSGKQETISRAYEFLNARTGDSGERFLFPVDQVTLNLMQAALEGKKL